MSSKIYFRLIFYLVLFATPNFLSAQCFPATAEDCPDPVGPPCTTSPSSDLSCSSADIDRTFTGGEDGKTETGEYYAPDSKFTVKSEIPATETVRFYAGETIILKTNFLARAGSVFSAKIDPTSAQFSPIDLPVSNFDDSSNPAFNHEDLTFDYGFDLPVQSPVVKCTNYKPPNYTANEKNLYFMSLFGPRYLNDDFDFHEGSDIVDRKLEDDGTGLYRDIICMCEGTVVDIDDPVNPPSDSTGKYVKIRCNKEFNKPATGWPKESVPDGNVGTCEKHYVNIAYRHLESIESCIQKGKLIAKGDKIGKMGKTGAALKHLHLSVQRKYTSSGFKNVHPMRIFRPSQIHLLNTLDNTGIKIYQLKSYTSGDQEALFRFVVPYNQIAIRYIQFKHASDSLIYDFEEVSADNCNTANSKEKPDCIDGLSIYPYPFNRGTCAYGRYLDKIDDMPDGFPASPKFNGGNYFPILQSAPYDKPNYVLDVIVDLTKFAQFNINNLKIRIVDIYGKGVEANATK